MIFRASDFHLFYQPTPCELRVYLKSKGGGEQKPNPFLEVLKRLGDQHEKNHLASFPEYVDLSSGPDREERTMEAVRSKAPVLYHPKLKTTLSLGPRQIDLTGEPDFLVLEGDRYLIRDSKMARRIDQKDHPEIRLQLLLYGFLFEKTFDAPPLRLEVHTGADQVVEIPSEEGPSLESELARMADIQSEPEAPYSPIGWSKCHGCEFHTPCWDKAKANQDVALLIAVDQNLAKSLRATGVNTVSALREKFNTASLAKFKKTVGDKTLKVGKKAQSVIHDADAFLAGKEILLKPPHISARPHYVMFDLEGMPPYLNELDKIYLWGLQVFGETRGHYTAAVAGFGAEGDKQGWFDFLSNAQGLFNRYGDIAFVHWAPYEKTFITRYLERYGDQNDTAKRVRENLMDLLPIAKRSLALPLPSFGLKVIEKHIGFHRTQDEYGGQWSMAKYIEATEMKDPKAREGLMKEILVYNEEDLQAMWAVLEWLRRKRRIH